MQQISSIFGWQHPQLQRLRAAPAGSPGSQVAGPNGDSGFQNSPSNLFPPTFQKIPWPKKEKIRGKNGKMASCHSSGMCHCVRCVSLVASNKAKKEVALLESSESVDMAGHFSLLYRGYLSTSKLLQNAPQDFWNHQFWLILPPCSWMNQAISWNLPLNPADSSQFW